jgi:hypothetical protein
VTWNSFEIDTGGGKISFMITIRGSLFIGTAKEDDGIIERIHELKKDKATNQFKIKGGEIWRRRARTPLFERVALQFNDIVNLLNIDKGRQEKVVASLIDIALDLSRAEEKLLDYIESENAAVSHYEEADGIARQKNAMVYKNPTLFLKDTAEEIIIRIVIAYRKLPEVISTVRGKTFRPGKTFISDLAELLPADHPDRKSFDYDNNWIKELYDFRGDIEHERWEILPFDVHQGAEGMRCKVDRCQVLAHSQGKNPISLADYLNVTLYNMVTFVEETVVLAMVDQMRYSARIVSLPETERPKRNYYRFVADLVPEAKDEQPTVGPHVANSSTGSPKKPASGEP